jgi:hypothetical protein
MHTTSLASNGLVRPPGSRIFEQSFPQVCQGPRSLQRGSRSLTVSLIDQPINQFEILNRYQRDRLVILVKLQLLPSTRSVEVMDFESLEISRIHRLSLLDRQAAVSARSHGMYNIHLPDKPSH